MFQTFTRGLFAIGVVGWAVLAFAADPAEPAAHRPERVLKDLSYGPHERNVLDLYLAASDKPTPLVIYIHGGGFTSFAKGPLHGQRALCLPKGVSYATISYRYSTIAPYPGPFLDSARAVQFLRSRAKEYNLDPTRIACCGNSAGAGMSLWLAFHDDLADPKAQDPVLRESTRITCAAVKDSQVTYDPRHFRQIVPGPAYNHEALKTLFGLPRQWRWENAEIDEKLDGQLKDSSPVNHLSRDDVPVYLWYDQRRAVPGDVHHVAHGQHLKPLMDKLGIECVVRLNTPEEPVDYSVESVEFILRHFGMSPAASQPSP